MRKALRVTYVAALTVIVWALWGPANGWIT
jgi:hypothetical protein